MSKEVEKGGETASRKRGVIYVVAGSRSYMGELVSSLSSLRRHEPDLPVVVYTNFSVPAKFKVEVQALDDYDNPHKHKVSSIRRSPFEETLFLDTDTEIRDSLAPLFSELEGKDFCAANAHEADYLVRPPRFIAMIKEATFNTGVLLYRKSEASERFLERWERAVVSHDSSQMWAGHYGDQYFFNDLIAKGACEECGLRWGTVENWRWNLRSIAKPQVISEGKWAEVSIMHERTNGMKIRKLMFALTDYATIRVMLEKAWRQTRKLLTGKVEGERPLP
ncbi:putative nucleotide-diphospho-sugar transferase [Pelagicoccus enzymogenes]|uniref:putative nucleotide-diphospho-sugar transferase n=1 Tax=Pelagicoccus enzymogenes TaxID=2773457 RepID=UPI00280F3E6A|nr:putative nucleotide-diphospho-sugar transferase [Pelagicoccus enzymogenes]MDQ8198912.1 putative nucleotide-diphospho-sugar transferase [Pelagicoccus enzymogenes]